MLPAQTRISKTVDLCTEDHIGIGKGAWSLSGDAAVYGGGNGYGNYVLLPLFMSTVLTVTVIRAEIESTTVTVIRAEIGVEPVRK